MESTKQIRILLKDGEIDAENNMFKYCLQLNSMVEVRRKQRIIYLPYISLGCICKIMQFCDIQDKYEYNQIQKPLQQPLQHLLHPKYFNFAQIPIQELFELCQGGKILKNDQLVDLMCLKLAELIQQKHIFYTDQLNDDEQRLMSVAAFWGTK